MGFLKNDMDTVTNNNEVKTWFKAARATDFPENGGACVKYKDMQIAVFNFSRRNEWYYSTFVDLCCSTLYYYHQIKHCTVTGGSWYIGDGACHGNYPFNTVCLCHILWPEPERSFHIAPGDIGCWSYFVCT